MECHGLDVASEMTQVMQLDEKSGILKIVVLSIAGVETA
jgi:hypothetical protein